MHKQNQQQMIGKTDKIFIIFFGVSRSDGPLKTLQIAAVNFYMFPSCIKGNSISICGGKNYIKMSLTFPYSSFQIRYVIEFR